MSLVSLVPLFVALIAVVIVIIINIMDDKVHPVLFVIALLNAGAFLAYLPFYEKYINEDWFNNLFLAHAIFAGLLLLFMLYIQLKKILFFKSHYQSFISSIKVSEWDAYYVLDHKDRIKEMSASILEELGFMFSDVKGKNFYEILNKSIRVTSLDDVETNNRLLESYYADYAKRATKHQLDVHTLIFQNHQGKTTLLRTTEQPIFILGRYRGRINIGEKRTDFNLVEIERKLKQKDRELDSLRFKYVATLELINEGLYYIDLDEHTIWASDALLKKLGFTSNVIELKDFYSYIYEDDLKSYLGTLSSLTERKQTYKTRYRMLIDGQYVWVDDRGKRIFEDVTSNLIVGFLDIVDTRGYYKTDNELLDSLQTEKELHFHLEDLYRKNKRFQLALFELKNIPEINKEYGREIGNMLISEYVKKLVNSFMSESSGIFRITGLTFAVTLIDPQKMQVLKKGAVANPKFLNMEMSYGAINAEVDVIMGVGASYAGARNAKELYNEAEQALNLTKHKEYKSNVCYYEDIEK